MGVARVFLVRARGEFLCILREAAFVRVGKCGLIQKTTRRASRTEPGAGKVVSGRARSQGHKAVLKEASAFWTRRMNSRRQKK